MRRTALAVLLALGAGACGSPAPAAPSASTPAQAAEEVRPADRSPSVSPTAPSVIPPSSAPTSTTTTTEPTTTTSIEPPVTRAPAVLSSGTTSVSWYGAESGDRTANGDRYDPAGLTFAHRSLPFGTAVRFCRGGACVVATCTDRGPAAWTGRDFDLSRATFGALAPLSVGVATVTWERVG